MIDRVKQFIDTQKISVSAFEQKIDASDGMIRRAIKNKTDIQSKWLSKISDNYPELNLEWLITGKGPMTKGTAPDNQQKQTCDGLASECNDTGTEPELSLYRLKTDYYGVERQLIPLYEIEASAGLTTLFSNQHTQVPLDFISVPNSPKCDGALSVRGDSMYPLLKAGDIICYKTISNIKNIIHGEMYLLDIDNGDDQYLTVKYVQKSDLGGDYIKVVSENRYHADKDIAIADIRALAIVKISIRYNTLS